MAPAILALVLFAAPDARLADAQRKMARGEYRAALVDLRELARTPERSEIGDVRFLLGLCLIELEDYEEAASWFATLGEAEPTMRDEYVFLRGKALHLWGSHLEAARVLGEVDPKGPRGEQALLYRVRSLHAATDFARLGRLLEARLAERGQLGGELSYRLGHARQRLGDPFGAYQAFREVWRRADAPELIGPAIVATSHLKSRGRPILPPAVELAIKAQRGRLGDREVYRALAGLAQRISPREPFSAELELALGQLAERRGRRALGREHFERAAARAPAEENVLRARAGLLAARVLASMGQERAALARFEQVADRFPATREAEEALFAAGELLLEGWDYEGAEARFRQLLLQNPVTDARPRVLWFLGWAKFRLGRYEEARQLFGSLAHKSAGAVDVQSRYWLARSLAQLGRFPEARDEFVALLHDYPLTHYAALAEDQLAEEVVLPSSPIRKAKVEYPEEVRRAEEYARVGQHRAAFLAVRELGDAMIDGRRRFALPVYARVARIFDRLGRSLEARRIRTAQAREHPNELSGEALGALAASSHPRAFEAEVVAAAREFDLPEALLFALIRTESNFNPRALSNKSAIGLCQVLYSTALEVAARLRTRITRSRLSSDPRLNVRIGAAYLRQLLDRYEGSEALALAGYNAGPHAVDRWAASRVRRLAGAAPRERGVGLMPDPDELVEEIPVAETRDYVKQVLTRARIYARLYGRPEPPAAPPEWVGALDEHVGVLAEPAEPPVAARPVAARRDLGWEFRHGGSIGVDPARIGL